jgi:hypothetical protein
MEIFIVAILINVEKEDTKHRYCVFGQSYFKGFGKKI